jgi:hypothetical protein
MFADSSLFHPSCFLVHTLSPIPNYSSLLPSDSSTIQAEVNSTLQGYTSHFSTRYVEEYKANLVNQVASSATPVALNRQDLLMSYSSNRALNSLSDNAGNTLSAARTISVGATATNFSD